jgi:hypothetical protein
MEGRSGLQAAKQRSSLAVERSSVQGRTQKHVKVRPRKAVLDFQIAGPGCLAESNGAAFMDERKKHALCLTLLSAGSIAHATPQQPG